jgi:hypothetical protein
MTLVHHSYAETPTLVCDAWALARASATCTTFSLPPCPSPLPSLQVSRLLSDVMKKGAHKAKSVTTLLRVPWLEVSE